MREAATCTQGLQGNVELEKIRGWLNFPSFCNDCFDKLVVAMPGGALWLNDKIRRLCLYIRNCIQRKRKGQLLKVEANKMESKRTGTKLLKLPPGRHVDIPDQMEVFADHEIEVRNCIYTFAATPLRQTRCCVLLSLALAQTCRQIRCEFRPVCLKAHMTINWRDIPAYFRMFYPTQNGTLSNIELAPEGMTVFTNTYCKGDANTAVVIDLLPIVKLGLADKAFRCVFVSEETSMGAAASDPNQVAMIKADVKTIQKLLAHRHPDWIADVFERRVRRLTISHIGTEDFPRARFIIGPAVDGSIPDVLVRGAQETDISQLRSHRAEGIRRALTFPSLMDGYVKHVDLRSAFTENRYIFLWEVGWERGQQECGVSFLLS